MMNRCKVMVHFLPSNFTYKELEQLFRPIGPLRRINLVYERRLSRKRCRGYGFAEFIYPDDAEKAILTLNNLQVQNRKIKVGYFYYGLKLAKILVKVLRRDITEEYLGNIFCYFGDIAYIKILRDCLAPKMYGIKNVEGISTGSAIVFYYSSESASNACKHLNGQYLFGARTPLQIQMI